MSPQVIGRLSLLCVAVVLAALPAHAVTYTETGDAGQTLATAQATAASLGAANQPLSAVLGGILSGTDIDLFRINITNPAAFSATTVNATTDNSLMDTQLFLFDSNGRPVYANNDDAGGISFGATLPAGSMLGPQVAGVYFIGIALSAAEPVNSTSQLLFATGSASTDLRGPNPSATGPLNHWDTSNIDSTGAPGSYQIDLTGATTAAVPEPTTFVLAVMGGLGLVGLKRSKKQPRTPRAKLPLRVQPFQLQLMTTTHE